MKATNKRSIDDEEEGLLPSKTSQSRLKRAGLNLAGTIFLSIGVIALIIPVLPTTPFVLLAAACYLRGSPRMHELLMRNRLFGKQLRDYAEGRGISTRAKITSLGFLWLCLGISAFIFVPFLVGDILLLVVGVAVSIHLLSLKTKSDA